MTNALPNWWPVAALALLAFGCCPGATLHTKDGSTRCGKIVSSDADNVYVSDSRHHVRTVPRETISDVDHPGVLAIGIGSALAAIGVTAAATAELSRCEGCSEQEPVPRYVGWGLFGLFGVPGGLLIGYGASKRAESAERFAPPAVR